jgi:Kef-type K+ transport system membrane component KefB
VSEEYTIQASDEKANPTKFESTNKQLFVIIGFVVIFLFGMYIGYKKEHTFIKGLIVYCAITSCKHEKVMKVLNDRNMFSSGGLR